MRIKLLDLNICWGGLLINNIIDYANKNNFDILTFQEVTGGILNKNNSDSFNFIKEKLGYEGVLNICEKAKEDKSSYFGNAIFYKKEVVAEDTKTIWLKKYEEFENYWKRRIEDDPRSALSIKFKNVKSDFYIITAHLAWGPTPYDKDYKLKQAKKLYEYLKKLGSPFILTGDFNLTSDSQVVKWMESLGRNLIVENNITNTLNGKIHKYKNLFPPGLAVDYIFVSKGIKVNNFYIEDKVDLSDHLALILDFEV